MTHLPWPPKHSWVFGVSSETYLVWDVTFLSLFFHSKEWNDSKADRIWFPYLKFYFSLSFRFKNLGCVFKKGFWSDWCDVFRRTSDTWQLKKNHFNYFLISIISVISSPSPFFGAQRKPQPTNQTNNSPSVICILGLFFLCLCPHDVCELSL